MDLKYCITAYGCGFRAVFEHVEYRSDGDGRILPVCYESI